MRLIFSLCIIVVSRMTILAQGTNEQPPIIDMHMHAFPLALVNGKPLPRPCINAERPCGNMPSSLKSDTELIQATLTAMQKNHIVLAFLSGDLGSLSKWTAAAPNIFIPSPTLPPTLKPDAKVTDLPIDTLRSKYERKQLKGMGEFGTPYFGIPANDETLDPYFALAESMDVPVLIHACPIGVRFPGFRSQSANPMHLEDVLVRHPKLRLIVENAGYPLIQDMIVLLYQYPGVYADLSTITWLIPREAFHSYLHTLIQAGFGKRLFFGSDAGQWPEAIDTAVEAIKSASFLSEEQKRDILYNNAARFLRLSSEEIAKHNNAK